MIKNTICCLVWLMVFSQALAVTYYVNQSGSGAANGTSLANAASMSTLNARTNSGDDIIILNGTITSTLTIHDSGTSGHVITYQFAAGAKFSKAAWGTLTSAAIYGTGKSFITIDGASVGIIECTDNGDGLGNQAIARGIDNTGCSDWEIKGLIVRTMYVHIYNTNNSAGVQARGINCENSNRLSIHDNNVSDCYHGIFAFANGQAIVTHAYYSNTLSACSTAINSPTLAGAGSSIAGCNIYNNDITMGLNWYDTPDANHVDGIHAFAVSATTDAITGLKIYNNYMHGDGGAHSTAPIYLEYSIIDPQIFNNLIVGSTNRPTDGYIANHLVNGNTAATVYRILNNTIVGLGTSNTGGIAVGTSMLSGGTLMVQNNIFKSCYVGIYEPTASVTLNCNYNDFFSLGYPGWRSSGSNTLAAWQTASGGDANSINTDPLLNGTYHLTAGSPCIGTGVDLSLYFTTDKAGSARTAPWDMGTYAYIVPPAPSDVSATTNSSSSITISYTDNSGGLASFSIERSLNGTTGWSEIATPSAGVMTYPDTGLAASTQYFYRMRALLGGIYSSYTSNVNATTNASPSASTGANPSRASLLLMGI